VVGSKLKGLRRRPVDATDGKNKNHTGPCAAEKGIAVLPPPFAQQSSAPMPVSLDSIRKEAVDAK
jgi:hypothetical protein